MNNQLTDVFRLGVISISDDSLSYALKKDIYQLVNTFVTRKSSYFSRFI